MIASLAKLLAQLSTEELCEMLNVERQAIQRAQVEIQMIEEALANASETISSPRLSPKQVRERVLHIIGELGPVPPKAVKEALADDSINIYNALSQLVKDGHLTREDGIYAIPQSSANGSYPTGREAGHAA